MRLSEQEIRQAIGQFDRWHYQFNVDGVLTPIHDENWINRHEQRKQYFLEPLVKGETNLFQGKRVLDLGCNAGFWSLQALEAGAAEVVGVDARRMHVDQANLIFELKGLARDRYRFVEANIFEYDLQALGNFDVVLCLGLFYHICKPIELLERISTVNDDLLIIDTKISRSPASMMEVHHEPLDDPRMAADYSLVFVPSALAVREMTELLGYRGLVLEPQFENWTGCEDYAGGDRKAFLFSKHTDIAEVIAKFRAARAG